MKSIRPEFRERLRKNSNGWRTSVRTIATRRGEIGDAIMAQSCIYSNRTIPKRPRRRAYPPNRDRTAATEPVMHAFDEAAPELVGRIRPANKSACFRSPTTRTACACRDRRTQPSRKHPSPDPGTRRQSFTASSLSAGECAVARSRKRRSYTHPRRSGRTRTAAQRRAMVGSVKIDGNGMAGAFIVRPSTVSLRGDRFHRQPGPAFKIHLPRSNSAVGQTPGSEMSASRA